MTGRGMPRVHAFGDDALGDLRRRRARRGHPIRPRRRGRGGRGGHRAHRGGQPGAERHGVQGVRAGARARRRTASCGFFAGVPTFIKDNVDVAGQPTMQGTDAWAPCDAAADGEFTRLYLATGLMSAGQDAAVGVRVQRVRRTSADRAGPQPVEHRPHRRRVVVGLGCVRRRRRGADRARQRRRRLDPDSGLLQRAGRAQAVARPAAAGRRRCAGCRCASSPTAW